MGGQFWLTVIHLLVCLEKCSGQWRAAAATPEGHFRNFSGYAVQGEFFRRKADIKSTGGAADVPGKSRAMIPFG